VNTAEDRALAGEATVDVLVVAKPIEKGSAADEISGKVTTEKLPAKVRVDDAVSDLATLGEKVAAVSLLPGEQVIASRFVKPSALEAIGEVEVPDGKHQVTVQLSPERSVGGRIEAGSTVGVLASFDPFDLHSVEPVVVDGSLYPAEGAKTPNSTHFILHSALVTSVQGEQVGTNEDDPNQAPNGNVLVTLALSAPQVEKLVFTAEHGTLWLTYEPKDAPKDGTQIVTRGVIY
jgi:pilus assembly protein CpaB